MLFQRLCELLLSKQSCLGQSMHPSSDFNVNDSIFCHFLRPSAFLDNFSWGVNQF